MKNSTPGRSLAIDTRPIGVVIFARLFRYLIFALLGFLFIWFVRLEPPAGLTVRGQQALGVFFVCVFLWVTQLLPLAVTSLLAVLLPAMMGTLDAKSVYAVFGHQAVFFILGAFILAAAVMKSGLSLRISLLFLTRFGRSPRQLTLSIFLLALLMACWIPEHAVAVILFPVVLEICNALRLEPGRSRFGASLLIAMAWGSVIGGVATLLGGARAPLAIAILESTAGVSISFFEWTKAALPITVLVGFLGAFVILRFFPADIETTEPAQHVLREKIFSMGKMTLTEQSIAAIMLLTVAGWVFLSDVYGLANIALLGVVLLFIFRLIAWKTVEQYVNWGVILMYGGTLGLGVVLKETGAGAWMLERFFGTNPMPAWLVVGALSLLAAVLTEGMSNSAVVASLLPVALGSSGLFQMDPRILALAVAIPSGLGFILPATSPPNAIAQSADYYMTRDILVPGAIMLIGSWLIFMLVALFYWPWIGFKI